MEKLLAVICFTICLILLFKALMGYRGYKNSINTYIYSNYLEYFYRYQIKNDCSKSSWLSNQLGNHRIVFSQAADNTGVLVAKFITIIHHHGVTCISFFNPNGNISGKAKDKHWVIHRSNDEKSKKNYRIINPCKYLEENVTRLKTILKQDNISTFIALHDCSDFSALKCDIPVVHYKDLVETLKQCDSGILLDDSQITTLFNILNGKQK